jgi:hypothetical protein
MTRKYWIATGIVAVIVVLIFRYFGAGHRTPSGQPELLAITQSTLPQFAGEFNRSAGAERVVLLMSPTCPVCLEGSSSVNAILQRHPGSKVRVFAVWEPILPTDWSQPSTRVLVRLSDPRVTQVWDKDHIIAGLVEKGAKGRQPECCDWHGSWWDVIAAYPPAAKWMDTAPVPELLNGTIIRTAPQLETRLETHP